MGESAGVTIHCHPHGLVAPQPHTHHKPTPKDDLMKMVIANIRESGPAKKWPHGVEIFYGEGQAFMQHLSARGWERDHIPMYCQEVHATRGEVEMKKGPPGGFYNGEASS